MADDGFSPEMLDAYFATIASRQSDGPTVGTSPDVSGALAALSASGVDPDLTLDEVERASLLARGRERALPRFQKALDRAQRYGYEELRQRIEGMVEAEAQRHARRGMKRAGGIGSDAVAAPAAPTPAMPAVAPPLPVPGMPSPMPMTLTGRENAPQPSPVMAAVEGAGRQGDQLGPINWGAPGPRPPTPPSEQPITDVVGGGPAMGGTENLLRDFAREATGIPMASRAGQNLAEAQETGDPLRGAAAIGQGALAAAPFVGPAMRTAFATVPRAIGAGLGAGLTVETASGRGPLISQAEAQTRPGQQRGNPAVMRLQEQLRDAGYYNGPIDGILSPDSPTMKAKAAFDAAEKAKTDAANKAAEATAKTKESEARAAEAAAKLQETERLRLEGERKAGQRAAGNQRLRELDDRLSTQALNAASAVGPYVGYALGGYLGHRLQNALIGRGTAAAEAAAQRGDAIMSRPVASGNVPGRVGRVNAFWAEGSPSRVEPFTFDPARSPYPYAPNTAALPAGDLYRRTRRDAAAEWLPVPAVGGLEAGIAEFGFRRPYSAEVDAAQAAVAQDPSEANIQRLQIARLKATVADTAGRVGQGVAGGALGTQILHSRGGPSAVPTALPKAETERGAITNLLASSPQPAAGAENMLARLGGTGRRAQPLAPEPPAPAPRGVRQAEGPPDGAEWNPRTNRWHLRGQMIGGPDRWPPPQRRSWRDYADE